ncbi:AEC family transporter [Aliagarivorans taiwanensis]|uniref:AEC family transporter n=1 Tax=Aliagarivorans taiwanensis TaxID=561966 RepID=UPI000413E78C|nr:AEC family transporter [Aliagarivorans taiwanensis]
MPILVVVVIGFILGQGSQRWLSESRCKSIGLILSRFSLGVLIPFTVFNALWQLEHIERSLLLLPLFGVMAVVVGVLLAFALSRHYQLSPQQTGAMVPIAAIYNWGSLGNLVVFLLFGESGVALLAIYKLCEELMYFGWVFPFARRSSLADDIPARRSIWRDPLFLLMLTVISLGFALNLSGIPRPAWITEVIPWTVPMSAILMIFAVGLTFNTRGNQAWAPIALRLSVLRPLLVLSFVAGLLTVFDLWGAYDGLLAGVCLMLSAMPTGFMATVPSLLYRLDQDVANTCWLYSFLVAGPVILGLGYVLG